MESKDGPHRAWQQLVGSHLLGGRSSGTEGLELFGLSNRDVLRRVRQLPEANRLENYRCWPGGKAPKIPMLVRMPAQLFLLYAQ